MHQTDSNEMHREKWELHKNATDYFEQSVEATPYKTAAVQPITFNLKKTSK